MGWCSTLDLNYHTNEEREIPNCLIYSISFSKCYTYALWFLENRPFEFVLLHPLQRMLFLFDRIASCSRGLQISKRWHQNCFPFSPSLTYIHANAHIPPTPSLRSTRGLSWFIVFTGDARSIFPAASRVRPVDLSACRQKKKRSRGIARKKKESRVGSPSKGAAGDSCGLRVKLCIFAPVTNVKSRVKYIYLFTVKRKITKEQMKNVYKSPFVHKWCEKIWKS